MTMPERVWAPESLQALADAHFIARVKGFSWARLTDHEYQVIAEAATAALRAERDALRDDLKAVAQAARHGYDEQAFGPRYGWRPLTEEELEAARAVLDRVAGEGKA